MKVPPDIYANIADSSPIIYVILQHHVHVVHIRVIYIWLRKIAGISVNIAGIKQVTCEQLQLHVHVAPTRNTNIFNCIFDIGKFNMAVERLGDFVKCAVCGVTASQKQGANNWTMCDTCFTCYCSSCFKRSSFCNAHNPWGNWLTADGRRGKMTFTRR